MASDTPKEFPDVSQKLSAPKKLSAFEKERLAAEEKRRREQAEAAAALREFEDSFGGDDDDDFDGFPSAARGPPTGPRGPGMGHGGARGGYGGPPRSGPGSLGPAPGPPPSLKRKRALDELREQQEIRREQEAFANEYMGSNTARGGQGERSRDNYEHDDPEDVAPRPTVQLSSLPPSTRQQDIMLLLEGHLAVHSVAMHPPIGLGKLSVTAVAALTAETSTSQIDTAVSALRDKYLGRGYRLSISRHLSSTALQPGVPAVPIAGSEPFGAQKIIRDQPGRGGFSMRNAPPPAHFAPPDAYGNESRRPFRPAYAKLDVQPPFDMSTIRAIHILVDRLLSEPDPDHALEIETELMRRPQVEADERFSFLYDPQCPAGVYYRYLLWNDDDNFETIQMQKRLARGPERIYEDVVIDWNVSQGEVPFLDLSRLGEALDHDHYESSEEESDDEEGERKFNVGRREGEGPAPDNDRKHLTPLKLAKFAWLLSRVPATHARLRMGDVAAISAFAINNAGAGAEEIVDLLVLNIEKPFSSTQCGKFEGEDVSQDDEDLYEPDEQLPSIEAPSSESMAKKEADHDSSQAKLVALYLINDVLHNSATAGVRNAWRYRQLFEAAFRKQETFKHLGQLGKNLGWGRMKENQWQNKIRVLFEIWEQGNVFASDVFEALKKDFYEEPMEDRMEPMEVEQPAPTATKNDLPPHAKPKFRRLDEFGSPATSGSPAPVSVTIVDGAPTDDLDRDDFDGVPMDDIDGLPMEDLDDLPAEDTDQPTPGNGDTGGDADGASMESDDPSEEKPAATEIKGGFSLKTNDDSKPVAQELKRNKQAEDMFADSDED